MVLKVLHAYLFIALKGTWTFLTAKGTFYELVLFELEGKPLKVQNVLLLEHHSQRDQTFSKVLFSPQHYRVGYQSSHFSENCWPERS